MHLKRNDVELIKPGDGVRLSDNQTIKDMLESQMPGAAEGLHLKVEKVLHIGDQAGMCNWYLLPLEGKCPENYPQLWLLFKSVDGEFDIRVYWIPDGFKPPRTRGELVNAGHLWLYKEPRDPSDFRPCELEYTAWIDQDTASGITKYDSKIGELHGECRETPTPSDCLNPQPATIVEYCTAEDGVEDPEILVLEIGEFNDYEEKVAEGGTVYFFLGSPIAHSDIEFSRR